MTPTPMYSLRTEGNSHRITKFVDGEVESSYSVSQDACDCPAGHRHTCRHRQMLPTMLAHGIADSHWFYLHDRGGQIVDFNGASKSLIDKLAASVPARMQEPLTAHAPELQPVGAAQHAEPLTNTVLLNIPGVQVFGIDDLFGIHNAIADAVGEPEAKLAVPEGQHCEAPLEPTDIHSPGDVYGEEDFVVEMFAKDVTPVAKPWRRI